MPCLPSIAKKLRRSKSSRKEENDFYFKLEPQLSRETLVLSSLPPEDSFRNVYEWLEAQNSPAPYRPCACCQDSPDCHYACVDITRRLITFSPQSRRFSADIIHSRSNSYLSQDTPRTTFSPRPSYGTNMTSYGSDRTHYASEEDKVSEIYYDNPDTPVGNHYPERMHRTRSSSDESDNTEYIYLDFQRKSPQFDSWQVTRKPSLSPVRSAFV